MDLLPPNLAFVLVNSHRLLPCGPIRPISVLTFLLPYQGQDYFRMLTNGTSFYCDERPYYRADEFDHISLHGPSGTLDSRSEHYARNVWTLTVGGTFGVERAAALTPAGR